MTFIATVIAKKGAVLIADSLVTTSRNVLEFEDFYEYLQSKSLNDGTDGSNIDTREVINLFKPKPSHTKDFQEKLFRYDEYTGIMTAGAATLNGKYIEEVIHNAKWALLKRYDRKKINERVQELSTYLEKEVIKCLQKGNIVRSTLFIITHYSKTTRATTVYKLNVRHCKPDDLKNDDFNYVSFEEQPKSSAVVCAGQNRISERILWGDIDTLMELTPSIANKIFKDFNITEDQIPEDYIKKLTADKEILPEWFYDDIKIGKLRELSLAQAVELACLLMQLEKNMQKYTENIPTVGGNIKVAVIDDKGFKFISGHELKAVVY